MYLADLKILETKKEINIKDNPIIIKYFLKDKYWKEQNNKEQIQIIIWEDFFQKITKKNPKKVDRELSRISINSDRLEMFMSVALWVINSIWENFFQEQLWVEFQKPELVLFEWNIDVEWKNFSWDAALDTVNNRVFINTSLILWLIDIDAIRSDIWFTLILAHEIWHSIQRQLWLFINQTEEESEHHADFVAWYTLQEMEKMWLLDAKDLDEALFTFGRLGDICELSRISELVNQKVWKNIWWDSKERKWNLSKWYNATVDEVLESFLPKIRRLIDNYKWKSENIILKNVS